MPVAEQDRTRLPDAATWASASEWNRPDVVQRHVAEKRVAAQVEFFELGRFDAHAHVRFSQLDRRGGFLTLRLLVGLGSKAAHRAPSSGPRRRDH